MNGDDRLWPASEVAPRLSAGEVHVWSLQLDQADEVIDRCRSVLSPDEQRRADHFLHDDVRRRFTACRGQLRALLAHYVGQDAKDLRFGYGPFGKPGIEAAPGASPRFNLSHSRHLAVLAVAAGREVGIDLERVRTIAHLEEMIHQAFTPDEQAVWHALPGADRLSSFFRAWTGKEAVLKLLGRGLSIPLNRVEVLLPSGSLRPTIRISSTEPTEGSLSAEAGSAAELQVLSLETFAPAPGFHGAMAISGSPVRMECRAWSGAI